MTSAGRLTGTAVEPVRLSCPVNLERELVLDSDQRSGLPGLMVGTGTAGWHFIECQLVLVVSIDEPVDPGRVLPIVAEGRVDGINPAHELDCFFAEDSGEHENFRGSCFRSRYSASVTARTNHTTHTTHTVVTIGTIWFEACWNKRHHPQNGYC